MGSLFLSTKISEDLYSLRSQGFSDSKFLNLLNVTAHLHVLPSPLDTQNVVLRPGSGHLLVMQNTGPYPRPTESNLQV